MPYKYDVFISYKRGGTKERWVNENFLPLFKEYLGDSFAEAGLDDPRIFQDTSELVDGEDFTEALVSNVAQSKCMVAIISPPYLVRSKWCMYEFMSMRYREEALELELGPNRVPRSLIWPILLQEMDPYPPIIRSIQLANYTKYNVIGAGFLNSEDYVSFQRELRKDVKTVTNIVKNIPAWKREWDTSEWSEVVKQRLTDYFTAHTAPQQQLISW
ncbi:toll/interleukin-1 receptor domain-containing protein [Chitinophaga silvisoli]|uniref:TIR domain-containing protein n=1 Tax=Chitinophaga silvisoli TaxID=2291814 RepID=A0A3E1NUR3_9BACT|nr:toll/interleukin-1 receptor domain-containing protein [Chitinophaga silvisoli]RFM31643.1 TIR domain-containing protein [Chitinophaga silvisoli]